MIKLTRLTARIRFAIARALRKKAPSIGFSYKVNEQGMDVKDFCAALKGWKGVIQETGKTVAGVKPEVYISFPKNPKPGRIEFTLHPKIKQTKK